MRDFNVLLVYPRFPDSHWGFREALKFVLKDSTMPPLGLITLASMFPKQFKIKIVDENVRPLKNNEIEQADLVGASAMIAQNESLEETIKRIKQFGKKVVLGGPYPTSYYEELLHNHPEITIVAGESERSLPLFLKDFMGGNPKSYYAPTERPDLSETPLPRWDLLDLKNYSSLAVQFSRGCPYDCEFCDIPVQFGRFSRTKPTKQMLSEFNAIYNTRWRGSVFIVDDNFIGNKVKAKELLRELILWQEKRRFPYSFFTEASVNLADDNELLELMVRAGFDAVFLGIESPNPEVNAASGKVQNRGDLLAKVRTMQRAGLEVQAGFIIGNDKDSPIVCNDVYNFIQSAGIVIPMVGGLTALRGTRLYERLQKEGRLKSESTGLNTHALGFNFRPVLDEKLLIEGTQELLERLYSPGAYYGRCRILNEDLNHSSFKITNKSRPIDFGSIHAFFRIMYENVLRHPDTDFIKYVAEVAFTNPKRFPEAIAHAVKLHHFQKMNEATRKTYEERNCKN